VFIPAVIWDAKNLTWLEKCLLAEIDALESDDRGCWASNGYLADLFDSSAGSIANMLTRLKRFGHIVVEPFDGFQRCIRVVTPLHSAVNGVSPSGEGGVHPAVNALLKREKRLENKDENAAAGASGLDADAFETSTPHHVPPTDLRLALPPSSARPPKHPSRRREPPRASDAGREDADFFRSLLPPMMSLEAGWQDIWGAAFDRLFALGCDSYELRKVCRWARKDSFWAPHLLSPARLLKRKDGALFYDRLFEAMRASTAVKSSEPKM